MMNDLEQAKAIREEARALLKQSDENLEKSKSIHDSTLRQSREIAYALSCLANPMMTMMSMSETEEQELLDKLKNTSPRFQPVFINGRLNSLVESRVESKEKRDVYDVIHAINVLAMANTDVLHVFSRFSGHVNEFYVRVCSTDSDYIDSRPECIFNESIYLEQEDALEKLLSIESQLTELIIEAREQAEAKAEVNA
ncbi:hypothetical protein L910_4071 [Vibrio fluvialis PG41]|uniref:Uncharacterized protein n=1 Tax=Vibrio fluvialis PG41 TaxID=1336752 RepID=S7JMT5_VIBFL|nr:hypothetical protein [Vibrio fluvialis]EPP23510.1 hypothetical protein L910_4071 [Vibrio fluvialis PG41]